MHPSPPPSTSNNNNAPNPLTIGVLALQGIDPRTWPLRRLLNAAEVAMMQTAEDDAERSRIRAQLYAPPPGHRPATRGPVAGRAPSASAVLAQVAAEDAELAAMRQAGR